MFALLPARQAFGLMPSRMVATCERSCEYFMDDDNGGATTVEARAEFLHQYYFPRLAWAKLTLSPMKTTFFTTGIKILGHQCTKTGRRPSADKIEALLAEVVAYRRAFHLSAHLLRRYRFRFDRVVCDEGHALKTIKSIRPFHSGRSHHR